MMALAGVELETLVSEPDALTTIQPQCANSFFHYLKNVSVAMLGNSYKEVRTLAVNKINFLRGRSKDYHVPIEDFVVSFLFKRCKQR